MKKLVSICVDGAAVNLGVRHGLAALIKKDVPWLVAIHCMNHRLELSAKDAFSNTFLNEVSTMLVNLHFVYENSPKRLRELRNVAEIMEERIRKPERATGTRWAQHKSRAIKSLLMGYDVIVTHLESMASGESSVKPVDKIKFKGYLTKLTSYKFVLYMLFFDALLDPLASFSCSIQKSAVDLPLAVAKLKSFRSTLTSLKKDSPDISTELSVLASVSTSSGSVVMYRKTQLSRVNQQVQEAFKRNRPLLIDKMLECVANRFDDLQNLDAMKGVNILSVPLWPTGKPDFETYGNSEVSLLVNHFKVLLEMNGVSLNAVLTEWNAFKHYVGHNIQGNPDVWSLLLTRYRSQFDNFAHLIEILLLFPVSNATVERGFSAMKRIKTDWRSRLNEVTIDHLLRISIDGPAFSNFDPRPAMEKFFSTPRRPDAAPYGSRKRSHSALDTESDA